MIEGVEEAAAALLLHPWLSQGLPEPQRDEGQPQAAVAAAAVGHAAIAVGRKLVFHL